MHLGNIDALRDWGHAKDYCAMQWLMLQQDVPEDFVIATGIQYTVRQFIEMTAEELGITIHWEGCGVDEVGFVAAISSDHESKLCVGDRIVDINPKYYRASEVDSLVGDSTSARKKLGWEPKISIREIIKEMVSYDLDELRKNIKYKQPNT